MRSIDELEVGEVTAAEFLVELRRIADALEGPTKPVLCGGRNGTAVCALGDRHRGDHVTADGRLRWLDD